MGEQDPGDETVLVVAIMLLISTLCAILREKLNKHLGLELPVTVWLFLLGLAFGGIMTTSPKFDEYIHITKLSPTLIFHVFLPVLIFDGSTGLKLRTLARIKWPAFWLAGPGLIIHTAMVAVFMWGMKEAFHVESWNWWSYLLFGSLLSATDPVAVIAVLKDLDADNWITTLIDGEAILNDGTAIIAFTIMFPGAAGHTEDFEHWWFYLLLVWLVVGAPIVGSIFAFILLQILKHCYNQPVVEAIVTLSGSYVAFIVADEYIRTSGVLVLATLGYHLAAQRGARLSRHSELAEHAWEVIVFMANAVIFALVGMIIGKEAIPSAHAIDWAILFILYVALHIFRAAMAGMFYKLLGDMTLPRFALLVMGALRGGVALALALAIHREEDIPERVRNQVLFLTGGIVMLSIVVNGSVSKVVVTQLGLNAQPQHKEYVKQRVEAALHYRMAEAVRCILQNKSEMQHYQHVNWVEVYEHTLSQFADVNEHFTVDRDGSSAKTDPKEGEFEVTSKPTAEKSSSRSIIRTLDDDEIVGVALRSMKTKLWHMRESDMVSVEAFELLMLLLDSHLDDLTQLPPYEIRDAAHATRSKIPIPCCGLNMQRDALTYESLVTFSDLLASADETLLHMMPQNRRSKAVIGGTEEQRALLHQMIHDIEERCPEVARSLQTNRVILHALHSVKEHLHHMHEKNGVPRHAFKAFNDKIVDLAHETAYRRTAAIEVASERSVFASCMLFRGVDETHDSIITLAFSNSVRKELKAGSKIALGDCLGIVLRGSVVKKENPKPHDYFPSDVFGLVNLLNSMQPFDYYAREDCVIALVPENVVLMLVNGQPDLLERLWSKYGAHEAVVALSR